MQETCRQGKEEPSMPSSPYDVLNDEKTRQAIYDDWNTFHSEIAYPDFDHFVNKELFVKDISDIELSQETFIQLICDRAFLFLGYADSLKNHEYPSLEESFNKIWLNNSTKNTLYIQQNGFMPTYALNRQWKKWKHDVEDIESALKRRKEFLVSKIKLPINAEIRLCSGKEKYKNAQDMLYSETEKKLAKLFHSYLTACYKQAYFKSYAAYQDNYSQIEKNALPWIHAVLKHSESNTAVCAALWIWVLFATYTTKLAKGTLKIYKFHAPPSQTKNDLQDVAPDQQNANTALKKQCNIILFDHLLDLLPVGDKPLAKFQFYDLSRYNRFSHYQTKIDKPYDFNCLASSSDYVDELGGLILYHIEHCLLHSPAWLTPFLPKTSKSMLNSFTDFLLLDSNVRPVQRSLTGRIKILFDNKTNIQHYVNIYTECGHTQQAKRDALREIVGRERLSFVAPHALSALDLMSNEDATDCACMLLEYVLKQYMLLDDITKLKYKAEQLFPGLFLSEHVFSE